MNRPPKWRRYLRLFGHDVKADVEDELQFHIQARRDDFLSSGLPPDDAAGEAVRRFGDVREVRDLCAQIERGRVRKMHWKESLSVWRQDLKYGARQLRRSPGFAITAILSLTLGIGANTAIFTLSDQILLRLLPVENPRELVQLKAEGGRVGSQSGDGLRTFSHPAYLALRETNTVFSGLTGQSATSAGLMMDGRNELVTVGMVAGNYFDVFGIKPFRGRMLTPEDDRVKMGGPVAVLRYEFWQSQFGANPAVVGSQVRLNGYPFTVVGIAAPGFEGTNVGFPTHVWVPVTMKQALTPSDAGIEDERYAWFYLFGRLKPGVSISKAEAAMKVTYRQRQEEEMRMPFFQKYPEARERYLKQNFSLEPAERGQSSLRSQFERPLILLQWLVGAVLLIACSNIAGLLLARGAGRQREMAIRGALGAGRGRLVRQLLAESLVFASIAGAAGILLSGWATRALVALVVSDPSRVSLSTAPDLRVLAFAAGLTIVTAILFGLMPAWQASRPPAAALKESAGAIAGGVSQARLRKIFVGFQVGLSTVLLIGAGLFARTLGNLKNIDLGMQTEHVATMTVTPAMAYTDEKKLQVYRSLLEALAAVPGVKAVGANTQRLLTGGRSDGSIRLPGSQAKGVDATNSFFNNVTPGYFDALGIPIKAGRDLTWRDWGSSRKYILVNETLVHDYLPGQNVIGTMLGRGGDSPLEFEIIGVFGNSRYHDPRGTIPRQMFFALDSRVRFANVLNIYARVQGDPRPVLPRLRDEVRRVDSNLLVASTGTLDEHVNLRLANERVLALLSIAFAVLAALLATIGLYGVLSFIVARRSREIGIRVALGATRGRVVRIVLQEMAAVILAGVAAGVAAGLACGRFVETQLYGVKASDTGVFVASVAALTACSLLAAAYPAWRASRLNPTTALRQE
jgi:predicted permease